MPRILLSTLLLLVASACSESGLTPIVVDTAVPESDTGLSDGDGSSPDVIGEPVADAGPDVTSTPSSAVQLSGAGSYDAAGLDPLTYLWTLEQAPSGSSAGLAYGNTVEPVFTPDVPGKYLISLTVQNTGGVWDSTPDKLVVDVEGPSVAAPVADAGPDRSVARSALVTLDGSGSSDPGGLMPLQYKWTLKASPSGSAASLLNGGAVTPFFTPDVAGDYVVELGVTNAAGVSDPTPDTVVITAEEPVVLEPISNAGADRSITRGDSVQLDGTGSTDPGGLTPLTWQWSIQSKPSGSSAFISGVTQPTPSIAADKAGTYVVALQVTNSAGVVDSTPDTMTINAQEPAVLEPVAQAGADITTQPLQAVSLDGTSSYDPGGNSIVEYKWSMIGRPSGSTSSLSSLTASRPNFFADLAGDYTFELTVRNSIGKWDSSPDVVVVTATPADGFYVEVSWGSEADLDLHVLNGSSGFYGPGDCSWCNKTPNWGGSGSGDDPSLDWDAVFGWGPETTTITAPASGEYEVRVHYYGTDGYPDCGWFTCPAAPATARIYLGGTLVHTSSRTLSSQGDVWNVATIKWPSGQVVPRNTMSWTALAGCP